MATKSKTKKGARASSSMAATARRISKKPAPKPIAPKERRKREPPSQIVEGLIVALVQDHPQTAHNLARLAVVYGLIASGEAVCTNDVAAKMIELEQPGFVGLDPKRATIKAGVVLRQLHELGCVERSGSENNGQLTWVYRPATKKQEA